MPELIEMAGGINLFGESGKHSPWMTWESLVEKDPDIIFVGEMTDQESATWTLTASETGHLVFSAIHTRDAVGTVTRLLDIPVVTTS